MNSVQMVAAVSTPRVSKTKVSKMKYKDVVEEPVVEKVVSVEEPVVEKVVSDEEPVAHEALPTFDEIVQSIITLQYQLSKLEREIEQKTRLLSKMHQKDIKEANKQKKRKVVSDPNNPKGIVKPVAISDKLADFLKAPRGSKMSRPEVTKKISQYLNERDLKHHANRSIFDIDDALRIVLGEPVILLNKNKPELGYGYCNSSLQSYLSPHFFKENKVAVPF